MTYESLSFWGSRFSADKTDNREQPILGQPKLLYFHWSVYETRVYEVLLERFKE